VAAEWHSFQVFAEWYSERYVQGWQLDKDIIVPGNRVYSLSACCLVPAAINAMLNHNKSNKGICPVGVDWHKWKQKFRAAVAVEGVRKTLGYFDTADEAEAAYLLAKKQNVIRLANKYRGQIGERTYEALINFPVDQVGK